LSLNFACRRARFFQVCCGLFLAEQQHSAEKEHKLN
jgi:hypothetical protein